MAKGKKKSNKQNKAESKTVRASTFTEEQMQHLIAYAIVKADEIKEQERRKQQDAELLEWRAATGYKTFDDKNKLLRGIKTTGNRLLCFIKLCFMPAKSVKGDRVSFALMKMFLGVFFGIARWSLALVAFVLAIYGIALFWIQETTLVSWLNNMGYIIWGILVFFLSRMFHIASMETDKIEDRNYLFGLFASVTSIVSIVIAIIALLKRG